MSTYRAASSHAARVFTVVVFVMACALLPMSTMAKGADSLLIETRATAIIRDIMEGITQGDFQKYTKDFSDAMRKSADHESFLQLQSKLRKHVGKFKSIEYIGFYGQEGLLFTLFKARFSKEKDDVLVNLVLDRHKDPKVTGLWFDAPSLRK